MLFLDLEVAFGPSKISDYENLKEDYELRLGGESQAQRMRERLRHAKIAILVAFNVDET